MPTQLDYVSQIKNADFKESVVVATDTDVAALTPGTTIDGETLSNGDRVLVFGQDPATEDGIYTFNSSGVPITRTLDFPSGEDITGSLVPVEAGTYAGKILMCSAGTVGTDDLSFSNVTGTDVTEPHGSDILSDSGFESNDQYFDISSPPAVSTSAVYLYFNSYRLDGEVGDDPEDMVDDYMINTAGTRVWFNDIHDVTTDDKIIIDFKKTT